MIYNDNISSDDDTERKDVRQESVDPIEYMNEEPMGMSFDKARDTSFGLLGVCEEEVCINADQKHNQ